jgi:hypothetical protein
VFWSFLRFLDYRSMKKTLPVVLIVLMASNAQSGNLGSNQFVRYLRVFGNVLEKVRPADGSKDFEIFAAAIDAVVDTFHSDRVRIFAQRELDFVAAKNPIRPRIFDYLNAFGNVTQRLHEGGSEEDDRRMMQNAINALLVAGTIGPSDTVRSILESTKPDSGGLLDIAEDQGKTVAVLKLQ